MSSRPAFYHALLRPCILQVLRATGYYSSKPAVLDTFTDLAACYLSILCQKAAEHAISNGSEASPSVVDIRMALQDVGALLPEKAFEEQIFLDEEDMRGVEEFLAWCTGVQNKAIRELAMADGDADVADYLDALKKKHSKTAEEAKYHATVLGKANDQGEVLVEGGGELASIRDWVKMTKGPTPQPSSGEDSRPPSSGLSSLGDRLDDDDEMDFS